MGQFCAPGITAEELDAQSVFQQFNLMADGGTGDAQFSCSHAKAAQAGGGFKGCQGPQGRQVTSGQGDSPSNLNIIVVRDNLLA